MRDNVGSLSAKRWTGKNCNIRVSIDNAISETWSTKIRLVLVDSQNTSESEHNCDFGIENKTGLRRISFRQNLYAADVIYGLLTVDCLNVSKELLFLCIKLKRCFYDEVRKIIEKVVQNIKN